MAKRRNIQDRDWRYNALKCIVDTVVKLSYSKIQYQGRENIPNDGAIIYAPNHTGTLMDALVILAMDRSPKVYVARADIFKNPKLAKVLNFFKMMPIMRMRDGFDEVKKNNKTIKQATEVLKAKIPFCIFPEGTHQAKHSMLPISKGIFRIALQAKENMPNTPLYIVPVSICYGNFWRYRSSVHIQYGKPMSVDKVVAENSEKTPQELMNVMKADLEQRMKENVYYIPNDENYDATYEICAVASDGQSTATPSANRSVKHIQELKESNPALANKLFALGNEAAAIRKKRGICLKSVATGHSATMQIFRLLALLLTLPYTIPAALLTSPLNLLCNTIFKKFKDQAFRNSVRFIMNLLLWPLLMVIYSIIAYICLPWQWALPATLALLPAPFLLHDAFKAVRLMVSDCKLHHNKELKAIYQKIKEILFNQKGC